MAQNSPNTFLRILIPIVVLAAAVGMFFAVRSNTSPTTSAPNAASAPVPVTGQTPAQTPTQGSANPAVPAAPALGAPAVPPTQTAAATPPQPAPGVPVQAPAGSPLAGRTLMAKVQPVDDSTREAKFKALGSTDNVESPGAFRMQVTFSPHGAGIAALRLAQHRETIDPKSNPETLQAAEVVNIPLFVNNKQVDTQPVALVPMAVLGVWLDGQYVDLFSATPEQPIWKQKSWGVFEAEIIDSQGVLVARVTREYTLNPGDYELSIKQGVTNLTTAPIAIAWRQYGPSDLPSGIIRYGGDVRRLRLGYLGGTAADPDGQFVRADTRTLTPRSSLLESPAWNPALGYWVWPSKPLWPNDESRASALTLSWAAMASRHFAVSVHPPARQRLGATSGKPVDDKRFLLVDSLDRVALDRLATAGAEPHDLTLKALVALRLTSAATTVAPGETLDCSIGVYAGPIASKYTQDKGLLQSLNLHELVLFTFGGPCAFCTFQWLAHFLHGFLLILRAYVVFDYAIGIVLLVVCVRTILHPITKWSQTSLYHLTKQMQALAPKQAKLKEKFGNDPVRLREEQTRLMREENINYAGALGCLPMFLQTPVWIALSAMIYFSFELRHTGAFFGIFQNVPGWTFLGDLSEPDRFIAFSRGFEVWGIHSIMGPIDSLNFLPFLLGIVFFLQQKLTPQAAATTPEAEQQQKIMKIMMVVMFPVMMYNAPSALAIYFIANTTLAMLESVYIRKQIEKAPPPVRKEPSKTGWRARLMKVVEDTQRRQQEKVAGQKRKPQ